MLNKLNTKRSEGFTIIEVMIVLAIAGLILLIVFLAVPALQRNSRNTSRKNDVAALLAAVNEYESNNSGQTPSVAPTWAAPDLTFPAPAGGGAQSQAKLGYYTSGAGAATGQVSLSLAAGGVATAAGTFSNPAHDYVFISANTTCVAGTSQASAIGGGVKSVTAIYEVESGINNFSQQCQAS